MKKILCLLIVLPCFAYGQFENKILSTEAGANFGRVAISPKKSKDIVVVDSYGNAFYSIDLGGKWELSKVLQTKSAGTPLLVADKKGDMYYFFTPSEQNNDNHGVQVSRSKDGGASWENSGNFVGEINSTPINLALSTDKKGSLYTSWTSLNTVSKEDCKSNIFFSTSSNGKNWNEPFKINAVPGDCEDEMAIASIPAVTSDGKLFLSWILGNTLYMDRSYDNGKTWLRNDLNVIQQTGRFNFQVPGLGIRSANPVLMADHSPTILHGMLHLSFTGNINNKEDSDVLYLNSANQGDFWSGIIKVNDDVSGKHQFMSSMALDPSSGFIYFVFYDRRNHNDEKTDVYLAYSKNGGKSFENIKISESPFVPQQEFFQQHSTHIDAQEGIIVPVWTRLDNGKSQIVTTVIKQTDLDNQEEKQ